MKYLIYQKVGVNQFILQCMNEDDIIILKQNLDQINQSFAIEIHLYELLIKPQVLEFLKKHGFFPVEYATKVFDDPKNFVIFSTNCFP